MERITKFAKSRTEDEWRAYVRERFEDLRILIRDNGEKAAVVGFVLGIGIMLFFKLFIILAVVAVAVYSTILIIADSE
jgi:hypothetical protein